MMRLPPFRYFAPRSVAEAVGLLGEHGREAAVVAGGTDLYPNMKRRQMEPRVLVGLRGIRELAGIQGSAREGMVVGAGATLTRVAHHPEVATHYPALARAAGVVSTPQLRNMGTLGGNVCVDTRCNYYNQSYEWRRSIGFCMKKDGDICLVAPGSARCWAVSSSDTAPVLWALGAEVTLVGPRRRAPDPGRGALPGRRDRVPRQGARRDRDRAPPAAGRRLARHLLEAPPAGSVRLPRAGRGGGRAVERGVAGTPGSSWGRWPRRRARCPRPRACSSASGSTRRPSSRAAEAAARPAKPLDNTDLVYHYRKSMTRVYVTRALRELAGLPLAGLWPSGMSARADGRGIAGSMGRCRSSGTWRLASRRAAARPETSPAPYGDAPVGFLIYGADGYMSATLMRPGRPHFASGDRVRGTPEEVRLANEGFLAYCGTYEVDEPRGIIVHHVVAADFPNNVGTDLVRRFVMENGTLVLETQPVVRAGKTWVFRLVWAPAGPVGAPGHAGRAGGAP